MISEFVIEKGIPLPKTDDRIMNKGRGWRHPWHLLEVGDSVLIDESSRVSASRYSGISGVIFVTKRTQFGLRIWRAA